MEKQILLIIAAVFLLSCGKKSATDPVLPTATLTPTITLTATCSPTVTNTATVTPTNTPDLAHPIGSIYAHPHNEAVSSGNSYTLDINMNAGTFIGTFAFTIYFNKDVTEVNTSQGLGGYAEFMDLYDSISINANTPGEVHFYGNDSSGQWPTSPVLYVFFKALTPGISNYTISVDSLKTTYNAAIGTPAGIGGTVIVQ